MELHLQLNINFGLGVTFFNLAFAINLVLWSSNWAAVTGRRFSNIPTSLSSTVACKLMTNVNYFKRHWDETTGEELTDSWGLSTYYFETDNDFYVTRQIQHFENGRTLKYHTEYLEDEFGKLSEKPLDIADFEEFRITDLEFEKLWQT